MEQTPLYILLADDDDSDRFLFQEAINGLEIQANIHTVNDGVQLMTYLFQEDTPLPHLIFLDLNMPRKNGFECLKEIRSNEKLKHLPVAIYSTSATEKDVETTFLSGANIYIKKPNDFNVLEQVLHTAIMRVIQRHKQPFSKADFLITL